MRPGGPWGAPLWGRPECSPLTEELLLLGGWLRRLVWLLAAALRTLVWERQQTRWRRQPGRLSVAPKTPAWAQRQQAQRLRQRQPHLPTISWSRALGLSRPAEAHRPLSTAAINRCCSWALQRRRTGQSQAGLPLATSKTVPQGRGPMWRTPSSSHPREHPSKTLATAKQKASTTPRGRLRPAPLSTLPPHFRRPTMPSRGESPCMIGPQAGSPNPSGRRAFPTQALRSRVGWARRRAGLGAPNPLGRRTIPT